MTMAKLRYLIGPMRPNFLILTPVCVFLGVAVSTLLTDRVSTLEVLLVFAGALMAHMSVNLLNEYDDYRSGLDSITVRTPFSGGSGTLPAHPEIATATWYAGIATFVGTALVGVYFVATDGVGLLPLGAVGLATVAAYTVWITRHPWLCLVAPGLGFGPLMVMGTSFVLVDGYSWAALIASLTPFFLVSGLLLINQLPDTDADRQVGRHHLPIARGPERSARVFAAFLLAAYIPPIVGIAAGWLPVTALLALAPLPVAGLVAWKAIANATHRQRLIPWLGANVAVIMTTIVLYGVGLLLA